MVSESTVSNTELSEFFGLHRVLGRELSEFLSACYLCVRANSPSLLQNSPSSVQNSVSSLVRNISSKLKGPGEEGTAGCCPKILLLKGARMVLCPFRRSHRKSALEIGHFLRQNFLSMVSGGPPVSTKGCLSQGQAHR